MLDPVALCKQRWLFKRSDGSVISEGLRLLPSGGIGGYVSSNEASWRLTEKGLDFLTDDDRVSTSFDTAIDTMGQPVELVGSYKLAPWLEINHHLQGLLAVKPMNRRLAVLVRTHVVNPKLFSLLDSLADGCDYDLFIAADETSRIVDVPGVRKLSHSLDMCAEVGLSRTSPKGSVLWYMGDYALYCSYLQIPHYDHYLMIEYDVHFDCNASMFCSYLVSILESYIDRFDMIGIELFQRDGVWDNYAEARLQFEKVFGAFFPFVLMSRRAIDFLLAERRKSTARSEEQLFCESWVPSMLAKNNYRIADLNEIIPGSWNNAMFRWNDPLRLKGMPPSSCILSHPVYDEQEFWHRKLRQALQTGHVERFVEDVLAEPTDDPAWRALRQEILKAAGPHDWTRAP